MLASKTVEVRTGNDGRMQRVLIYMNDFFFFTFPSCENIKFKNIGNVVEKKRPRAQSGKMRDVMCPVTLCLRFTIISSTS